MALRIFNTKTRALEEFSPLNPPRVTMYNCGPTVYNFPHIGNLRAYVFADILKRTLMHAGYSVDQIINITDVGHLVSDGDDGEDKMVVGATREGKSVEDIIQLYSQAFFDDCALLNIIPPLKYPRATKYIDEQKKLITTLHEKGFLYTTGDGVYFDTSKFPRYAEFARLNVTGMEAGTRVDMGEKKLATDFAVWKFSPLDGKKREQEWDSPLGIARKGFPGWHIECSAIAMTELGETIDIHTGGVDHIPIHHTNEIAQSECATGHEFARYWVHSAHMLVEGEKMSKSLGNTYRLSDLAEKGISPLAFRYWLLTASYRTQVNFTWESVKAASDAYDSLRKKIFLLRQAATEGKAYSSIVGTFDAIDDDLNTAALIARIWGLVNEQNYLPETVQKFIREADEILGLKLFDYTQKEVVLTPDIERLLKDRKEARDAKNWADSDRLREEIRARGYEVKDTDVGQSVSPL